MLRIVITGPARYKANGGRRPVCIISSIVCQINCKVSEMITKNLLTKLIMLLHN